METWGQVPKEQNDSQLISEAITAAIVDHEADPEAHQGDGESLQNHKSDEVIDHPAESIVEDKYEPFSIPISILDMSKLIVQPQIESTDYWTKYAVGEDNSSAGIGSYALDIGPTNNNYIYLNMMCPISYINFGAKNPLVEMSMKFTTTTAQTIFFGCGNSNTASNFFGFKVINSTLYAYWCNGSTTETHSIGSITSNTIHKYRAAMTSGTKIDFYIDNVLVYTGTVNLPSANQATFIFWIKMTCNENDYKNLTMMMPLFIMDY